MQQKMLAVIPARGGSKRIPHKNIKDFNGRPLIAYSVQAALDSGLFDSVIVSTDDPEIASVALRYGAEVPFMRSADLSGDYTDTHTVTADAWYRMNLSAASENKESFSAVCTVYATAPLLEASSLVRAAEFFLKEDADYLYSCCEYPFPIQRACRLDKDGTPVPFMPECMSMRSQDLEKAYQDAGQFYFYSDRYLSAVHSTGNIYPENMKRRVFELPRTRVIDIDTPEDWDFALLLAEAHRLRDESWSKNHA